MNFGRDGEKLFKFLKHQRYKRVCVEAGHIYANRPVTAEQTASFSIGGMICQQLAELSITALPMVLIDNYNVPLNGFDQAAYLEIAASHGFVPAEDSIIFEADMIHGADGIIAKLISLGKTRPGEGQSLFTAPYNARLLHEDGRYSCPVLDAAFSLMRFSRHDYDITVLPQRSTEHNYKEQQQNVRQILRCLGLEQVKLANFFFDEVGNITVARYQ